MKKRTSSKTAVAYGKFLRDVLFVMLSVAGVALPGKAFADDCGSVQIGRLIAQIDSIRQQKMTLHRCSAEDMSLDKRRMAIEDRISSIDSGISSRCRQINAWVIAEHKRIRADVRDYLNECLSRGVPSTEAELAAQEAARKKAADEEMAARDKELEAEYAKRTNEDAARRGQRAPPPVNQIPDQNPFGVPKPAPQQAKTAAVKPRDAGCSGQMTSNGCVQTPSPPPPPPINVTSAPPRQPQQQQVTNGSGYDCNGVDQSGCTVASQRFSLGTGAPSNNTNGSTQPTGSQTQAVTPQSRPSSRIIVAPLPPCIGCSALDAILPQGQVPTPSNSPAADSQPDASTESPAPEPAKPPTIYVRSPIQIELDQELQSAMARAHIKDSRDCGDSLTATTKAIQKRIDDLAKQEPRWKGGQAVAVGTCTSRLQKLFGSLRKFGSGPDGLSLTAVAEKVENREERACLELKKAYLVRACECNRDGMTFSKDVALQDQGLEAVSAASDLQQRGIRHIPNEDIQKIASKAAKVQECYDIQTLGPKLINFDAEAGRY